MAHELMPLDTINKMAEAFTQSGFFGYKNSSEAMTLMLLANANGLHPVKAAERYHIIQGRPAMKADAMLAVFQEAGGQIKWLKRTPDECTLWLAHPQGGELEVCWTMKRAQAAGLTNKSTWKQYPTQMLAARCVSEGVRALYPACLCGLYTPEEVTDFDAKPKYEAPQVTVGDSDPTPAPADVVTEVSKATTKAKKAKAIDAEVKAIKTPKQAFLEKMKELELACPAGYARKLELMKIDDITLLADSQLRSVYVSVKKHVDELLSFGGEDNPFSQESPENINNVQLFND